MAKQPGSGYQPLSYFDRVRLNAAIKHLRSRYHSVRVAAHKEVQKILSKPRGLKDRTRSLLSKSWQRVTLGKEHRCRVSGCKHATREAAVASEHARKHQREAAKAFTPPSRQQARSTRQRALTGRDLRERQQARTQGQGSPQRQQVPVTGCDRTIGTRRPSLQEERAASAGPARPVPAPAGPQSSVVHGDSREYVLPRQVPDRKYAMPAAEFRDRAAKAFPAPMPADTVRAPRQSRIRLPRLIRARS